MSKDPVRRAPPVARHEQQDQPDDDGQRERRADRGDAEAPRRGEFELEESVRRRRRHGSAGLVERGVGGANDFEGVGGDDVDDGDRRPGREHGAVAGDGLVFHQAPLQGERDLAGA